MRIILLLSGLAVATLLPGGMLLGQDHAIPAARRLVAANPDLRLAVVDSTSVAGSNRLGSLSPVLQVEADSAAVENYGLEGALIGGVASGLLAAYVWAGVCGDPEWGCNAGLVFPTLAFLTLGVTIGGLVGSLIPK